jgi:hypothetical protein
MTDRSLPTIADAAASGGRWRGPALRFARHYLIMVSLMYAGMLVLNPVYDRAARAAVNDDPWTALPVLSAMVMAVNMTVPMVVWMRRHGHSRSALVEMAASMLAPTAVAVAAAQGGVISDGSVMTVAHTAMFPAMLVAMLLRKSEYTASAEAHRRLGLRRPGARIRQDAGGSGVLPHAKAV